MAPGQAAKGGPLGRAVATGLRQLSTAPGEEEKEEPQPASPVGGLREEVKAALEGFRSTARWMIAAFGGVFVALVGSTPFTDFADLQGWSQKRAIVGLAIGGVGALLGIWAASRVFEPEDHSLAEVKSKLQKRECERAGRIDRFFRPGRAAMEDYCTLLKSEPLAYFGQVVKCASQGVQHVINEVGKKENEHCSARVVAAGAPPDSDAAKAEKRAEVRLAQVRTWEERLVLVGIAHEARGKYIGSRRWLMAAAVAVFLGVVLYFAEVTQDAEDGQGAPPVAALLPISVWLLPEPAARFERASGSGCVHEGRQPGFVEGDPSSKGPWRVLLIPPGDCRPIRFELTADEGGIAVR